MAYILKAPFYGSTDITPGRRGISLDLASESAPAWGTQAGDLRRYCASLRENHINYLFALPGCLVLPRAEFLRKAVDAPGQRDFKIFRLL